MNLEKQSLLIRKTEQKYKGQVMEITGVVSGMFRKHLPQSR